MSTMDTVCNMARILRRRGLGPKLLRIGIVFAVVYFVIIPLLDWKYGFYFTNFMYSVKDFLNPWRYSMHMGEDEENTLTSGRCIVPVIVPFRDDVAYLKKLPPLKCKGVKYGSLTDDGHILINAPKYDKAYVEYIERDGDDFHQKYSGRIEVKVSGGEGDGIHNVKFRPTQDFLRLTLETGSKKHEEFHATIVPKQIDRKVLKSSNLDLNVAMVMFDSQSNANIQRLMSIPYKFLTEEKDTIVLQGHTIVGDGTTAQLCAIMTGLNEHHLPEARRSMPGAKHVDSWPFLYWDFKKNGYITMLTEDNSNYGTFNYRLKGFKDPPTDHDSRNFMNVVENVKGFSKFCVNNVAIHKVMFDYTLKFYESYTKNPKFSLTQISGLCHNTLQGVSAAEDDLMSFLRSFDKQGRFNDTIFILFGDHGARTDKIRDTANGKLEERLPYMSLTFPTWFKKTHKEMYSNLRKNAKFFTTHFDIHATLTHLLSYPKVPKGKFGRSLFSSFDVENRGCADTGVADHWCPCLQLEPVDPSDPTVLSIAKKGVEYINSLLHENVDGRSLCSTLTLGKVLLAQKKKPNWKVEQFSHSRANERCDSCVLVFDKRLQSDSSQVLDVTFTALPSNGTFEMSATVFKNGEIKVSSEFSRTSLYGKQPHCIMQKWPNLRRMCYCKTQLQEA